MNAAKFKLLFTIAIALIIIIICMRLFSCNGKPRNKVVIDNTIQLRKDLEQQTANYKSRIDSIKGINQKLRSQAVNTQSEILKIKQENRSLKRTINDLLTVHYTTTDTITKLQNCDSLAVTLQETEALSNKKDSVYESLTGTLQRQIEIQDSVIDVQKFQNDSLQANYYSLLDKQSALITENNEQRKTIKRQKAGKAFLGVVVAVVAGLFTWHTLK